MRVKSAGGAQARGRLPFATRVPLRAFAALALSAMLLVGLGVGCAPDAGVMQSDGAAEAAAAGAEGGNAILRISADEAHEMMTSNEVVVLDVRTPEEYAEQHIVNARLLTLDAIGEATAAEVAPNKEASVLVYCRTGVRSAEAARKLEALGYREIYDFSGIMGWPYATIDGSEPAESGLPEGELPVGVKVVCGKTKAVLSSE